MRRPRTATTLPKRPFDWLLAPRRLLIGAVLFGLALIFLVFRWAPEPQGFWLGISIFVAGWIFTAAVNVRNRIKQHTFDLILRTRFEPTFVTSARAILNRFGDIDIVGKEDARSIYHSTDVVNLDLRNGVSSILNFYEILSISIYYFDADEVILKEYFYDLIVVSYKRLQHFVSVWREHDPEAFVYFEWLYTRWVGDQT